MDGRREPRDRDEGAGSLYIRMQGNLRGEEEEHTNSSLKRQRINRQHNKQTNLPFPPKTTLFCESNHQKNHT